MAIQLTVLSLDFDSNEAPRTNIYLKEEITLGRDDSNDVVLCSPNVEEFHARLRVAENGGGIPHLFITDLGTDVGTKVENTALPAGVESTMDLNQRIVIGDFLIKPSHIDETHEEEEIEEEEKMEEKSETEDTSHADTMTNGSLVKEFDQDELDREETDQEGVVAKEESVFVSAANDEFDDVRTPVATIKISVKGEDIKDLNFAATRLYDICGKVIHKGNPLARVTIDAGSIGTFNTDDDGVFRFIAIPEATQYTIRPSLEKFSFQPETIKGRLDDNCDNLEFGAVQLFSISGRVVHKGKALEGVEIDGGPLGVTHTDADGNYSFDNVPDGTKYTLTAKKGNFVFGKMQGTMSGPDKN